MAEDNPRLKKMEEILVRAFVTETLGDAGKQKQIEHEFYELAFEGCREIPKQIAALEEEIAAETNQEIKAVLEAKRGIYQRLHQQYNDLLNDFNEE